MAMIRKVMPAQVSALGDDEVEVVVSTGQLARDGHIFEPAGAELDNYRKNPIVLWQHDPMHPVGRAEQIAVNGDKIVARIKFAPAGVSHKADEIRGLVKSGIVSGVSVGMDPIDAEPLDPKKPRGGQRVTRWEMLECSFCSVPVDTDATVTARAEPQTDKEKAGMSDGKKDEKERALKAARTRMLPREFPAKPKLRSLGHVAQLAWALDSLGYLHNCTAYEAEIEGDQSPVPAMLGEALQQLGQALCAMTEEEVAELMTKIGADGDNGEEADEIETRDLPDEDRAFVAAGKTPRARAWRRGIAIARAGKTLSASNEKKLEQAQSHHERAVKHHRALGEHHDAVGGHIEAISDAHDRAQTQHAKLGEAIDAAHKAAPSDDTEKAQRAYRALGGHLDDAVQSRSDMADAHEDVGDAHRALGRSLNAAQRAVQGVVDGAVPGGEDSDSKKVQTSASTADTEGSRSVDFRRRQADVLALTN